MMVSISLNMLDILLESNERFDGVIISAWQYVYTCTVCTNDSSISLWNRNSITTHAVNAQQI